MQRFASVLASDPVELRLEVGTLEVVQCDRVDDALVRRGLGPLVHLQHEARADRALYAVRAEAHQVLALCGIVRVVPVANVHEVDRIRRQAARPLGIAPGQPSSSLRAHARACVNRARAVRKASRVYPPP